MSGTINTKNLLNNNSNSKSATIVEISNVKARTIVPQLSQGYNDPSMNRDIQTHSERKSLQPLRKRKSDFVNKNSVELKSASKEKKELINFDALMMDEDDHQIKKKRRNRH